MVAMLVTASERSSLEADMPTASEVYTAFTKYTPNQNPVLGAWVGPAPRITRTASFPAFITTASWLYSWPDTAYTTQNWVDLQSRVSSAVQDGLREQSGDWSTVSMIPYSPAIHGSMDWWVSGQASVTQSANEAPTGIGRTGVPDNPLGPTTIATHPPTLGDVSVSQGLSNLLATAGWVAAGGVVLYLSWPWIVRWQRQIASSASRSR